MLDLFLSLSDGKRFISRKIPVLTQYTTLYIRGKIVSRKKLIIIGDLGDNVVKERNTTYWHKLCFDLFGKKTDNRSVE